MLVFVSAYLWLSRRVLRFPRALLLLPIAIAAVWFANAGRLVAPHRDRRGCLPRSPRRLSLLRGMALFCAGPGPGARRPFFARDGVVVEQGPNPTVAYPAPLLTT
jgi:hypothetical protein